jgi:hypothetical protein
MFQNNLPVLFQSTFQSLVVSGPLKCAKIKFNIKIIFRFDKFIIIYIFNEDSSIVYQNIQTSVSFFEEFSYLVYALLIIDVQLMKTDVEAKFFQFVQRLFGIFSAYGLKRNPNF